MRFFLGSILFAELSEEPPLLSLFGPPPLRPEKFLPVLLLLDLNEPLLPERR
jgi:hypothetical protein